jgi:HEAT repeat protein
LGRFALLAEVGKLDEGRGMSVRAALLRCIRDPREALEVRRRAVESVSYFGGEEIRRVISGAYADDAEEMWVSALLGMGRSLDGYWTDALMIELSNPSPAMRYEAARACGELESPEAMVALIELLNDVDIEVQCAAMWALGQIGGDDARDALRAYCESEDTSVAEAATEALSVLEFNWSLPEVPWGEWPLDGEAEGNLD